MGICVKIVNDINVTGELERTGPLARLSPLPVYFKWVVT